MKAFTRVIGVLLATGVLLVGTTAMVAADGWVGAWAYVASPQPPGQPPATTSPAEARLAALVPLGAAPAPAAPRTFTPGAPLIENPGNVEFLPFNATLANVTVRQLVRVSVGGDAIRLRFTNEEGRDVLPLGPVHVGEAGADGSIVAGTDHAVTFDGRPDVVIPASAPLLSDPVSMTVKPLDRLLISVHVPGAVPRSGRSLYMYVASTPGDQTGAVTLPGAKLARVSTFVSEVEVNTDTPTSVVVALGDSITEGATSTANAFRSWPDRLAERLVAAGKPWAVVNAGISGNRLLRYGAGPSTLARLDRDVLSVPAVKAIILLEGINDIGSSFSPANRRDPVTAEALEAADKQIIARAHEKGIKIYGALLTPYRGRGVRVARRRAGAGDPEYVDQDERRLRRRARLRHAGGRSRQSADLRAAVQRPRPPASERRRVSGDCQCHRSRPDHEVGADRVTVTRAGVRLGAPKCVSYSLDGPSSRFAVDLTWRGRVELALVKHDAVDPSLTIDSWRSL